MCFQKNHQCGFRSRTSVSPSLMSFGGYGGMRRAYGLPIPARSTTGASAGPAGAGSVTRDRPAIRPIGSSTNGVTMPPIHVDTEPADISDDELAAEAIAADPDPCLDGALPFDHAIGLTPTAISPPGTCPPPWPGHGSAAGAAT